jgi:hypothetical protein
VEVVAQVPAHREAVGDHPHELPLASEVLEEHEELELEEDDRVNGRPATFRVERLHQLPHEREIQPRLKTAVEVVLGYELFERDVVG